MLFSDTLNLESSGHEINSLTHKLSNAKKTEFDTREI